MRFGFGCLIGFSLGVLGAGGSILTVPILVYAMGVPVQAAAGTSLAIVGLNAATGAVGALIGAGVAGRLRERALRTTFALLIVGIGVYSFFRSASTLIPLLGIN